MRRAAALAAALLVLAALGGRAEAAEDDAAEPAAEVTYDLVSEWLIDGDPHKVDERMDVAVGPEDQRLYVLNNTQDRIEVWSMEGELLDEIELLPPGPYPTVNARGLEIDDDGVLHVAEFDGWRIHRFATDGTDLGTTPLPGRPTDLARTPDGRFFVKVTQETTDDDVIELDPSGTSITGGFDTPYSGYRIIAASNDELLLTSTSSTIVHIGTDGTGAFTVGAPDSPQVATVDVGPEGDLYLMNPFGGYRYLPNATNVNADTTLVADISNSGNYQGRGRIEVSPEGTVVVTETYYADVRVYVPSAATSAPSAPRNLDTTADGATVTLDWDAPADGGHGLRTGYVLRRDGEVIADLGPTVHQHVDAPGDAEEHTYEVVAVNSLGEGDPSSTDAAALGPSFSDVGFAHPFVVDVEWAAAAGVAGGFADGTYRPGNPVTRQAMAAFLFRLAGAEPYVPPGDATFTDVTPTHAFYGEIEWMADEDISTGYPDGTYRPGNPVTRQAMAAFLFAASGDDPPLLPPTPTFTDVPATHPFVLAIEWMAHTEISTGYPNDTYRPTANVTRQAMAAFLHRLDQHTA